MTSKDDSIRTLAYQLWLKRGAPVSQQGDFDWFESKRIHEVREVAEKMSGQQHMVFFIHEIKENFPSTPLNYILQRLPMVHLKTIKTQAEIDSLCHYYLNKDICLATENDHPGYDEKEALKIRMYTALSKEHLSKTHPMILGEHIVDEHFTFLLEAFDCFEVGTPVLRQETNYAVLYFLFPKFRVKSSGLHSTHSMPIKANN